MHSPRRCGSLMMKTKSLSLFTAGALALALTGSLSANDHKDEFKAMDANVSQAEHLAFSQSLFAQSDADRDANVTAAEWDTAATAARPEREDGSCRHCRSTAVDGYRR